MKTLNTKLIITLASVFIILAITAVAFSQIRKTKAPDPKLISKPMRVKFMASKEFSQLQDEDQKKFLEETRGTNKGPRGMDVENLSEAERRQLRKNIGKHRQAKMKERMERFSKMTQEEKNRELDKILKDMQEREKNRPKDRKKPTQNDDDRKERMQDRHENTDSETRAQRTEFMRQLKKRAEETGLTLPKPPGPPGR